MGRIEIIQSDLSRKQQNVLSSLIHEYAEICFGEKGVAGLPHAIGKTGLGNSITEIEENSKVKDFIKYIRKYLNQRLPIRSWIVVIGGRIGFSYRYYKGSMCLFRVTSAQEGDPASISHSCIIIIYRPPPFMKDIKYILDNPLLRKPVNDFKILKFSIQNNENFYEGYNAPDLNSSLIIKLMSSLDLYSDEWNNLQLIANRAKELLTNNISPVWHVFVSNEEIILDIDLEPSIIFSGTWPKYKDMKITAFYLWSPPINITIWDKILNIIPYSTMCLLMIFFIVKTQFCKNSELILLENSIALRVCNYKGLDIVYKIILSISIIMAIGRVMKKLLENTI